MKIVLDASVAVEWFLPGTDREVARRAGELLKASQRSEVECIVPDFFWAEVGSVFAKAVRQKRWSPSKVSRALRDLGALEIATEPSRPLLAPAMNLALSYGQSVYDTMYVAVALKQQIEVVTLDLRLFNALSARYPVRWLSGVRF
ncbi:MAG TPA: type II toxin-antitoxin system VapC family toxin [Bryobacteraceae bacterium]|nr:type II toxin-antitoxin system VapC family toxin [Bryobacteraceae bacterium]